MADRRQRELGPNPSPSERKRESIMSDEPNIRSIAFTMELPQDLEALLLKSGPVEWGHTGAKPDDEHLSQFAETLRLTREHFSTEGNADLQGLYLDGSEVVLAHTGTSPNSAGHARILAGLWNALHAQALKSPEAS